MGLTQMSNHLGTTSKYPLLLHPYTFVLICPVYLKYVVRRFGQVHKKFVSLSTSCFLAWVGVFHLVFNPSQHILNS